MAFGRRGGGIELLELDGKGESEWIGVLPCGELKLVTFSKCFAQIVSAGD